MSTPSLNISITPIKQDVKSAWAEWLNSKAWTYWTTFTTRYELSLPSARRLAERIAKFTLDGNDTYMFWVAEEFDVRDGQHIHALIKTDISWDELRRFGLRYGRCYIESYDPAIGAGRYVSKYISKRMTDYDWIQGRGMRYQTRPLPLTSKDINKVA